LTGGRKSPTKETARHLPVAGTALGSEPLPTLVLPRPLPAAGRLLSSQVLRRPVGAQATLLAYFQTARAALQRFVQHRGYLSISSHERGAHAKIRQHQRHRRKRSPVASRCSTAPHAHFLRESMRKVPHTEQTPPTGHAFSKYVFDTSLRCTRPRCSCVRSGIGRTTIPSRQWSAPGIKLIPSDNFTSASKLNGPL
jgi:hypothetical protein